MKVKIELLTGKTKTVDVPKKDLKDDLGNDLSIIFHYGLDIFQLSKIRDVDIGDVIFWKKGKYLVCNSGFECLTDEQYKSYQKIKHLIIQGSIK